jgi:1,4-alpha-glucan branching enzyme
VNIATLKGKKLGFRAEFEYYAPEAKKVQLAGNFNKWKPEDMRKERDGKWRVSLDLPSGRYEYRYLVDGSWQNDQRPVECVPNTFGSWNCVIEIG